MCGNKIRIFILVVMVALGSTGCWDSVPIGKKISRLPYQEQGPGYHVSTDINRELYSLLEMLTGTDIIVNGIMQTPNRP